MAIFSEHKRRITEPTLASRKVAPCMDINASMVLVNTVFPRLNSVRDNKGQIFARMAHNNVVCAGYDW